jgi:D-sedoheptulose 7-phosphate isomerase
VSVPLPGRRHVAHGPPSRGHGRTPGYHDPMEHPEARLDAIFEEHLAVAGASRSQLIPVVAQLAAQLSEALEAGGKLIVFGNGGSAADAQHFAAELTGRFLRTRPALPALALSVNSSTLTAIANDFAYEAVFERQVQAFCGPSDLVVGISTSGTAESVARGLRAAGARGAQTWALTGADGGVVGEAAAHTLCVPSSVTARVQEMHITIIHAVSELVDASATGEGP